MDVATRGRLALAIMLGVASAALVVPGQAGADTGMFTCRATLIWNGQESFGTSANEQNSPCVADSVVGFLDVYEDEVEGYSFTPRGFKVRTYADVWFSRQAKVEGGSITVTSCSLCTPSYVSVRSFSASATVSCFTGVAQSKSEIGTVIVDDTVPVSYLSDDPLDLPLADGSILHLNSQERKPTEVIQRAVWLERPGYGITNDIVIGEARAGLDGSCS